MSRAKLTQEEFIARAKERHGIAYSFAKTVYTHSHEKVTVTCHKHGDWTVLASQLIRKNGANGCPMCSGHVLDNKPKYRGRQALTTEEWIDKAIAVHGHTYDYTSVTYDHSLKKVTVTCKLHGPWQVTPNNHVLRKSGCPVCAGRLLGNRRIFEIRSKTTHGTKYDYKMVQPFLTAEDTVTIGCTKHGRFEQRLQSHLDGHGCPYCGWENGGKKQRGVKKRKMKVVTI